MTETDIIGAASEDLSRIAAALERIAENLERVTGKYFKQDCIKVLGFKQVGA